MILDRRIGCAFGHLEKEKNKTTGKKTDHWVHLGSRRHRRGATFWIGSKIITNNHFKGKKPVWKMWKNPVAHEDVNGKCDEYTVELDLHRRYSS